MRSPKSWRLHSLTKDRLKELLGIAVARLKRNRKVVIPIAVLLVAGISGLVSYYLLFKGLGSAYARKPAPTAVPAESSQGLSASAEATSPPHTAPSAAPSSQQGVEPHTTIVDKDPFKPEFLQRYQKARALELPEATLLNQPVQPIRVDQILDRAAPTAADARHRG